jgi:hypothetical protein
VSDYEGNVKPVPAPAGYEAVSVDLVDYGFNFDVSDVAAGSDIAFLAKNVGNEPHEIVLVKVPAGLNIKEALSNEEEETPVELVGFTFAPPGENAATLLLDGATGRYAMVCFFQTANGTPHWQLGMLSDFTIGASATPTPSATPTATATSARTPTATPSAAAMTTTPIPPRTGSGGMLGDEDDGMQGALLAGLGLAIVLGAYGTYELRKRRSS